MSDNHIVGKMKNKFRHDILLKLVKLMNVVLITIPFVLIWYGFYNPLVFGEAFYRRGNVVIIFIYCLLYALYGRTYDAFLISYTKLSEIIYSQLLALIMTNVISYFITLVLLRHLPSVIPYLFCLAVQIVVVILWGVVSQKWYFRTFPCRKAIVFYDMLRGKENLVQEYGYNKKFEVCAIYQIKDFLEDLNHLKTLDEADTVFLVDINSHDRNIILKYCITHGITCFIQPRIGDLIMSSAHRMHMFHLPILRVDRYGPRPEYVLGKRVFDIVAAGLLLIVISPVFLITAIAIHSYDKGPVFYKQVRLTKDGKEFKLLKFRSMIVDAEKDGVARLSTGDVDSRITPVGRFIRKVRLDELPQLLNIIRGDMSVVGPRPERPEIARQYEEYLPEFELRLQAKAGLTGYAQVYGKYNTDPYDKLEMDLLYIANPSFAEDLRIIFATIKILFLPESTEGIAEGQTTASKKKEE